MSRYPSVPLAEILTPRRDEQHVKIDATYRTAGIYSFGRGLFSREPIPGTDTRYRSFFRLHEGDFVYSRLFAWEGAVAVVPGDFDGLFVSQEFPSFAINRSRALPHYVAQVCRWPQFHEMLAGKTKGLGLRRQRVHEEQLLPVEVPLPDLDEQRRVALLLEKLLEDLGGARAAGARSATLGESIRWAIVTSRFRDLAAHAPIIELDRAAQINPETVTPATEVEGDTFTYVDIGSVGKGTGVIERPDLVPVADAPSRARRRLRVGDVIVSTVRPNLRAFATVPAALDGAVASTGFAVLRPSTGVEPDFLLLQLMSDTVLSQLIGETRGGHYPAIAESRLRRVSIVLPNLDSQREVVAGLRGVFAPLQVIRDGRRKTIAQLDALQPAILNRAFAGEL